MLGAGRGAACRGVRRAPPEALQRAFLLCPRPQTVPRMLCNYLGAFQPASRRSPTRARQIPRPGAGANYHPRAPRCAGRGSGTLLGLLARGEDHLAEPEISAINTTILRPKLLGFSTSLEPNS